jgi:hypothetical protein
MLWIVWLFFAAVMMLSAAAFFAPRAHSAPCVSVTGLPCNPSPWNGQLMPTWDTPGTYGGWTTNPVQCSPASLDCSVWVAQ